MPKTKEEKEELRKKIVKNIKDIQAIIPEFRMTKEQIDEMLSDERIGINEKAMAILADKKPVDAEVKKKYVPGGYTPEIYDRTYFFAMKTDGSEASEKHNDMLFKDLTRDDEIGEAKTLDFMIYSLNLVCGYDASKLSRSRSEKEYFDYAFEHAEEGGLTSDNDAFISTHPVFRVKPESQDKYIFFRRIGETCGGAIRDSAEYAANEFFLTMPLKYMTDDQVDRFYTAIRGTEIRQFVVTEQYRRSMYRGLKDFRFEERTPFTANDFVHAPRYEKPMGGFLPRKQALIDGQKLLSQMKDIPDAKDLPELKEQYAELVRMVEEKGLDIHEVKDVAEISAQAKKLNNIFYKVAMPLRDKESTDKEAAEMYRLIVKVNSIAKPFVSPEWVYSLVFYYNEDKERIKGDAYSAMENAVKELNDFSLPLRTDTKFGEKQRLSQEDIFELRTRMATALKRANDYLDNPQNESHKYMAQRLSNEMARQIHSLRNAIPGMTYDEAVSDAVMTIDITGRKIEKVGNCLSSRLPMTITGPDGNDIKGFFTEKTTLDMAKSTAIIKDKLYGLYPDKKAFVDELVAFYMGDPGRAEKESKINEINNNKKLKGPEKVKVLELAEAAMRSAEAYYGNRASYIAMLGDESSSDIENRNIAMSEVADLLQVSGILARSVPLKVVNNGKEMTGCFMENAKGYDLYKIGPDSPFLEIDSSFADYTPALKQLADMQILDYVCGNIDRHSGNLFYQFDENNKLSGVTGIDNDLSFTPNSGKDYGAQNFVTLANLGHISASMAEKVHTLNPEELKNILAARGIAKEGIEGSLTRLSELKEAMNSGQLRIMDDDEFANHKLADFMPANHQHNLFSTIESYVRMNVLSMDKKSKERKQNRVPQAKPKTEAIKAFAGIRASLVQQDYSTLEHNLKEISDAQRNVHFGSEQYDNVEKYLTKVIDFVAKSTDKSVLSTNEAKMYANSLRKLEKYCKIYMDKKEKEGPVDRASKTGKRYVAVTNVRDFCSRRVKTLNVQINPKSTILEMKEEADRVQMEVFKNNPKMAGDLLKSLNNMANAPKCSLKTKNDVAEQLKTITKFMKENDIKPESMGINQADINAAKKNISAGRKANAEIQKAKTLVQ